MENKPDPFERLAAMLTRSQKNRRPIQLTATANEYIVLCNDGTMWRMFAARDHYKTIDWMELPPVPRKDHREFELMEHGKLVMKYGAGEGSRLNKELGSLLEQNVAGVPKFGSGVLTVDVYSCNADTGKREKIGTIPSEEWEF